VVVWIPAAERGGGVVSYGSARLLAASLMLLRVVVLPPIRYTSVSYFPESVEDERIKRTL
jgi:hypothetical protein